ncbi:MAG TPA: hypothetical protein VFB66_28875 [Tepidisphaeraceae bacterium]|nr:hypothetical protein [Tepidisphaeraceae bacterium]
MFVGLLGWVVLGLIIGFIASKFVNLRGDDARLGIGVAALGAVLAGAAYSIISGDGVSAWNLWSLIFAAAGAVAGAVAWHGVRSRYISKAPYTHRSSY